MGYTLNNPASAAIIAAALPGPQGIYLARGLERANFADAESVGWVFDDFLLEGNFTVFDGWGGTTTLSASRTTLVTNAGAGIVQLATGTTASSKSLITALSGAIANIFTAPWYVAVRFRVTTAINNTAFCGAGLNNAAGNKTVIAGVFGAASTTQFGIQYDGNAAGSFQSFGVAIDTAWHVCEMHGNESAVVTASIDGRDEVTLTQAAAPTDSMNGTVQIFNGATAADRQIEVDWFLTMGERI